MTIPSRIANRPVRRGSTFAAAFCSALALMTSAPARAQDKPITLRLSSWVPAQHPLNASLQAWADDIRKASNGSIVTTLFPSEQLGKAFDHFDMVKDGIADVAWVNPGYQPGRFPVFSAAALPFLFANAKGGSAALDDWYRPYAGKEMKDVRLCLSFVTDPATFHTKRKLLEPSDLKGMKVRPATATVGNMVTLLGGTNVQASAPESRDMLERGVADGMTFPWGSVILFGIDKVVKEHMDAKVYTTPLVLVFNKDKYDAMSATQKHVVDEHCNADWAVKVASGWADFEAAGRAKIAAEPGHEIYTLTAVQDADWRKAVAPLEAQWAADVTKAGYDPKAAMASLKSALARRGAGL